MKYIAWTILLGSGLLFIACGDDTETKDTTSTTTTSGGGSTSGTGGTGGAACAAAIEMGDVCDAVSSDTTCVACTRSDCCAEVTACVTDEACTCVYRCFLAGCDPIGCITDCPASDAVTALTQCAVGMCPECAAMQ